MIDRIRFKLSNESLMGDDLSVTISGIWDEIYQEMVDIARREIRRTAINQAVLRKLNLAVEGIND